jgi:hypothetical protein
MHSNNGGVHVQRGRVVSVNGDVLVVLTSEGEITVEIGDDTHLNADPERAIEVKVRGEMEGDVLEADEVKSLCPNPHAEDDDDGEEDDSARDGRHGKNHDHDKDDDDDKDRGHGNDDKDEDDD